MSKIIFLGFPAHGHTSPTIGLVKELVNAGHEIVYYSVPDYKDMILHAGAEFRDYNVGLTSAGLSSNMNPFHNLNLIYNEGMKIFDNLLVEFEQLKPDLIIHDSVSFWGKCLAATLKIPAISSLTMFAMTPELLHADVSKWGYYKFMFDMRVSKHGRRFPGTIDRFTELQKRCGLPAAGYFDPIEFYTSKENLNLVYVTEEWQPQREAFDESFCYIGPSITSRGNEEDFTLPDKENKPLIYISLGTMLNKDLKFYKMCFKALGNMDVKVILSLGKGFDPHQLKRVPKNFSLYSYVPQFKVLEQTDLFISQGGMNSVNESLYFSVPMIISPVTNEQKLNGKRTAEAGAGIMINKLTAPLLKEAVETILDDPHYKKNSDKIAQNFKTAGGAKLAVEKIHDYLESAYSLSQQARVSGG